MSGHDGRVRYTLTPQGAAEIGGTPPRVTPEISGGERWELTDAGRALLAGSTPNGRAHVDTRAVLAYRGGNGRGSDAPAGRPAPKNFPA